MDVPKSGERIGRYHIERVLGRGGFGVVYLAQNEDGDEVAVKFMRPPKEGADVVRKRFQREFAVINSLQHRNIIRVFDIHDYGEDALYFAMEYLQGEDLSDRLETVGALDATTVCQIGLQLLDALALAHQEGIVHRDIKPANIFLVGAVKPRVKVLDFGIATAPTQDEKLTRTGRIIGTPRYMAPDTIARAEYSGSTDVYSSGLVILEMLRGAPVFSGDAVDILRSQLLDPPPIPESVAHHSMGIWLKRALSKEPETRFVDARDALRAFREVAADIDARGLEWPTAPKTNDQTVQAVFSIADLHTIHEAINGTQDTDNSFLETMIEIVQVNDIPVPKRHTTPAPTAETVNEGIDDAVSQTDRMTGPPIPELLSPTHAGEADQAEALRFNLEDLLPATPPSVEPDTITDRPAVVPAAPPSIPAPRTPQSAPTPAVPAPSTQPPASPVPPAPKPAGPPAQLQVAVPSDMPTAPVAIPDQALLPDHLIARAAEGPIPSYPLDEPSPEALDASRPRLPQKKGLSTLQPRQIVPIILVVMACTALFLQFGPEDEPENTAPPRRETTNIRVESSPNGAGFTVDGTLAGTTPAVIEWPVDGFPVTIDFQHPNGASKSVVVPELTRIISVVLEFQVTPPRDDKPLDPSPDSELVQKRSKSSAKREDLSQLFDDDHDAVNRQILLYATTNPTLTTYFRAKPKATNGQWWSDTQAALSKVARVCMDPKRYEHDAFEAPKRGGLLVVNSKMVVSAGGRISFVRTEGLEGGQVPPKPVLSCIDQELEGVKVGAPPEGRRVEKTVPIFL